MDNVGLRVEGWRRDIRIIGMDGGSRRGSVDRVLICSNDPLLAGYGIELGERSFVSILEGELDTDPAGWRKTSRRRHKAGGRVDM